MLSIFGFILFEKALSKFGASLQSDVSIEFIFPASKKQTKETEERKGIVLWNSMFILLP